MSWTAWIRFGPQDEERRDWRSLPKAWTIRATRDADDNHWEARQVDETHYEVVGKGLERMVAMTDLENEFALRRLQKSLDKLGVTKRLKSIGAKDGDTVKIRDIEFEYEDEYKVDEDFEAAAQGTRQARERRVDNGEWERSRTFRFSRILRLRRCQSGERQAKPCRVAGERPVRAFHRPERRAACGFPACRESGNQYADERAGAH